MLLSRIFNLQQEIYITFVVDCTLQLADYITVQLRLSSCDRIINERKKENSTYKKKYTFSVDDGIGLERQQVATIGHAKKLLLTPMIQR